jgi:diguanylate cyclase (GGDEF)-like protein
VRDAGVARQPDGLPEGVQDLGEMQKATRQPRSSAAQARLARQALDQLPLSVAIIDRSLRLQYWNQQAAGMLGIGATVGGDLPMLSAALEASATLTPRQCERVIEFCTGIITQGEPPQSVSWLRLSLGRQQRVAIKLNGLSVDLWLLTVEHLHPVAEEGQAARDAMLDALTGLSNRRHFNDSLREVMEQVGPHPLYAVMVVDLDHFKSVNDTLGHSVGDALLSLVAQRLRRQTRQEDVIARFGGDEFAILLPDGRTAEGLADRLIDLLSRPFLVEGHIVNVGASIGISRYGDKNSSAEGLLHEADQALRDAKGAGRQTWRIFDPAISEDARARRNLETDLRKALSMGELWLAYQPQLNLRSNRVTGFEALLRWNHPTRGTVLPATFIPVAEDLNVSSVQLEDCDRLYAVIKSALEESGLAPARLEIEITVGALLAQEAPARDLLHRLHGLGVHLVIEDFGTEYRMLSQLPPPPVLFDKIKIGQSIISVLGQDSEASMIMEATTRLGSALGKTLTAEGVETADQARLAEVNGCTDIQGYLVSRPVPAAEIDSLLHKFAIGSFQS